MSLHAQEVSIAIKSGAEAAIDLMAGATTAATAATSTREPAGWPACGAIGGAEDRKLYRVPLARAFWAGNFLLLIKYNFLEARLAILADVFVDGHRSLFPPTSIRETLLPSCPLRE